MAHAPDAAHAGNDGATLHLLFGAGAAAACAPFLVVGDVAVLMGPEAPARLPEHADVHWHAFDVDVPGVTRLDDDGLAALCAAAARIVSWRG